MLLPVLEADPLVKLAGCYATLHLPGGVEEGYVVGVELRADGQLAGGLYVHEGDLREVDGGRAAETRHAAEGFAQFVYGIEIELAPQIDLYASVAGVPYFYTVQDRPLLRELVLLIYVLIYDHASTSKTSGVTNRLHLQRKFFGNASKFGARPVRCNSVDSSVILDMLMGISFCSSRLRSAG